MYAQKISPSCQGNTGKDSCVMHAEFIMLSILHDQCESETSIFVLKPVSPSFRYSLMVTSDQAMCGEINSLFSVTERQTTPRPVDPCNPDPCGPYSQCRRQDNIAACSCLPGYVGTPPNCRPECRIHSECASNLACINEKCRDPCPGACGAYAECEVINHNAVCRCQQGYEGDPFSGCRRVTTRE